MMDVQENSTEVSNTENEVCTSSPAIQKDDEKNLDKPSVQPILQRLQSENLHSVDLPRFPNVQEITEDERKGKESENSKLLRFVNGKQD